MRSAFDKNRVVFTSLAVAALGGVGVLVAALIDPARALLAWVAAYGFALATVLGALILVMIFHVTRATWPMILRPLLMATCATMPIFALLFVPIAIGTRLLYPWARPEAATFQGEPLSVEISEALEHQRSWNQPTFFLVRAAVYLATWIALAVLLRRSDLARGREPEGAVGLRQRRISAAGLPVVAFTLTFAAFDWFMSLEPGWVANMYGLYFFAGGLASAVSLVTLLAWASTNSGRVVGARPDHFHALGRLMLMATVFWAYIAFFQLMLVWIADLPRESSFYIARSRGAFSSFDALLLFGHFIVPFLALLSRPLKRRPDLLTVIAAWLILMEAVDVAWLVLPSRSAGVSVLDLAPFLVVGGIAVAYGKGRLMGTARPDLDATLTESLEYRSP